MTREEMRYKLNELRMMLNDGEHGEEQGVLVEIISELDKWEEPPIYTLTSNTISALSADVRPNIHARWESDGHGHIICTACKEAKLNTHRSKFCDSCGAIMDGERQCEHCLYHEDNGCTRWVCADIEDKPE